MAIRKHRKGFRNDAQKRAVSALSRYSRTLFIFAIAFSSVVIFMGSRLLRNARKPVQYYMRLVDNELVLEGDREFLWDEYQSENLIYEQNDRFSPTSYKHTEKESNLRVEPFSKKLQKLETNDIPMEFHMTSSSEENNYYDITSICQKSSIYLLVLILSEEPMTSLRNLIRQTWCKRKIYSNNRRMTCLFVVGQHGGNSMYSDEVELEAASHRDVILTSIKDDIRNSTEKLLYGMKWVVSHCKVFRYVLKTEDDVMVNTNMLMEYRMIDFPESSFAGGKCTKRNPVRNKLSKYYVSIEQYQDKEYPLICNNMGYLLSNDVFTKLYEVAAETEHRIPLDDVFFGVLLHKLQIIPRDLTNFVYGKTFQMNSNSSNSNDVICNYVITHLHVNTENNVRKMWEAIDQQCT